MSAIDDAKKLFGDSFNIGEDTTEIKVIPTGFDELNKKIFVCGGLPRGRAMEVAGTTHKGKSTFCNWLIGEVQRQGGTACLFEPEGTFVPSYAADCGVNLKTLVFPTTGYGEDTLHKVKLAIASNLFDIIVLDSQDALKPSGIGEVTARSLTMNEKMTRPKMLSDFCRDLSGGFEIKDQNGELVKSNVKVPKLTTTGKVLMRNTIHKLQQKKTCLIVISHLSPTMDPYGKAEETKGGGELRYLYSLRIWLTSKRPIFKTIKKIKVLKHYELQLKIDKSKIGYVEGDGKLKVKMTPQGRIEPLTNQEQEEGILLDEILK